MTRLMKNYLILLFLGISFNGSLFAISSLANNDPYPVYSAIYDPYLTRWQREWLIGCNEICCANESWSFAASVFEQKASKGRDFAHHKRLLGDLTGPWNMVGMLYGERPTSLANTQLGRAETYIFGDLFKSLEPGELSPPGPVVTAPNQNLIIPSEVLNQTGTALINTGAYILTDSGHNIGYFSVPIKYRKIGVRFEFNAQPFCDFGFTLQGGVSEIRQTVERLIDRSPNAGPEPNPALDSMPCPVALCGGQPFENNFYRNIPVLLPSPVNNSYYTDCNTCAPSECDMTEPTGIQCTNPYQEIENQLMVSTKASLIFNQIGLNDCNFEATSFEDVRVIFWWRHIFEINKDRCSWAYFLLTPSVEFNFIVPSAAKKKRKQLYSVPFGNDGHWSVGFDAGISLDFVETVEIAFYGGLNYFLPRDHHNYRMPTSVFQQSIFPFAASVKVKPGFNFDWKIVFNAYHFVDRLSAYADYVLVKHEADRISLLTPNSAFLISKAECTTKFTSQFVNAALYYDISPNIQLGALAQFPVAQRNAYRSTTYLGTFHIVF
jgi:hypothetical protein